MKDPTDDKPTQSIDDQWLADLQAIVARRNEPANDKLESSVITKGSQAAFMPGSEKEADDKLKRLAAQVAKLKLQLESIDVQLVAGGDQTALEKGARQDYETTHGAGRTVPKEEVFSGSVADQRAAAERFAGGLPPLAGGSTSQYNLWSGMGKPGEEKEDTPRGKAEAMPGFVMQQTKDFAAAIWELRNAAGFIDSEKNWPWDPSYHLAVARWLEEKQATTGWPSEAEIGKKLDELRAAYTNPDSRVKIKRDGDDEEGELIGFNRKVGDSIFESPSADLATRIGRSMVPVQSFGLDTHDNPKATVQWQVEIPNVIKQAEALQAELNGVVKLAKELAALTASPPVAGKLSTAADNIQAGAVRYKTGARMLKTAIDKTAEWWKTKVGWTNAELMLSGRTLVLGALADLDRSLKKLGTIS